LAQPVPVLKFFFFFEESRDCSTTLETEQIAKARKGDGVVACRNCGLHWKQGERAF